MSVERRSAVFALSSVGEAMCAEVIRNCSISVFSVVEYCAVHHQLDIAGIREDERYAHLSSWEKGGRELHRVALIRLGVSSGNQALHLVVQLNGRHVRYASGGFELAKERNSNLADMW